MSIMEMQSAGYLINTVTIIITTLLSRSRSSQ